MFRILISSLMILFCCLTASDSLFAETRAYVFGVVPQFDARRIQDIWHPVLKSLTDRTGIEFELKPSPSIPEFEKAFSTGEYDVAYMNPYHLIEANRSQGYLPMVRDVGQVLYGIIVVRKDSPIQRVEELDGKTIAFPAPNALGAALIPRAEFSRKFHINVMPRYVRSHTSVYLNVVLGQTDAGGGVQNTLEQQKPEVREALRILYRTMEAAPHPIAVHPRVPEKDREQITAALIDLGAGEEGRAMLAKIPIQRIGKTNLADYEPLRSMGLQDFYIKE